ncbi:MAG: sigma 54-interacting transcriptional regulator [Oceanospirillaceae bacterium]|nr:sigma 54-interacting transcriptional regulator [Oceanospirillaceae bacterium]
MNFAASHCASIPVTLLQSISFGYDKGTVTGTDKSGRRGLFEIAANGTTF